MIKLDGKNVAVTGSKGFIGQHVCKVLESRNSKVIPINEHHILNDLWLSVVYLKERAIDYVIHLAGYNGGIEFNRLYPADIFFTNTLMGINIIHACAAAGIKKIVSTITSCAYPEGLELIREEDLHNGPPNDGICAHGYAKRNLDIASRMFRRQYGLNAVTVCPNTVYGPEDRTDPLRTKVMMALIAKFSDAMAIQAPEVVCWGTGAARREFIYVEDTAELIVRSLELYDEPIPLNIATGQEYTIKELSEMVAKFVGYSGKIVWDTTKSDGAKRKALDTSRMQIFLGNFAFTPIEDGIKQTISWYRQSKT